MLLLLNRQTWSLTENCFMKGNPLIHWMLNTNRRTLMLYTMAGVMFLFTLILEIIIKVWSIKCCPFLSSVWDKLSVGFALFAHSLCSKLLPLLWCCLIKLIRMSSLNCFSYNCSLLGESLGTFSTSTSMSLVPSWSLLSLGRRKGKRDWPFKCFKECCPLVFATGNGSKPTPVFGDKGFIVAGLQHKLETAIELLFTLLGGLIFLLWFLVSSLLTPFKHGFNTFLFACTLDESWSIWFLLVSKSGALGNLARSMSIMLACIDCRELTFMLKGSLNAFNKVAGLVKTLGSWQNKNSLKQKKV